MAKNSTATYDPRQIWAVNLAPLVTAARAGAVHASRTARQERARVRRESPRWRKRRLVAAAAGLAVAGAAGGACAALLRRRHARRHPGTAAGTQPPDGAPAKPRRSTMEAGRERVTGAARGVLHRIRSNGGAAGGGEATGAHHRAGAPSEAGTAGGPYDRPQ